MIGPAMALFIAYQEENKTKGDIWVLPLEGDRKPFPFMHTEFWQWAAAFSPDGRWLAYASDESGKREVYVQTFTGTPGTVERGRKWLVSTNGGNFPKWRRDGKELFYRQDRKLIAVEIESGETFEASAPSLLFEVRQGSVDDDVTADGKRFIIPMPLEETQVRPSITVVLNWQSGLKR
jgi:Tol biopolymer transport system component